MKLRPRYGDRPVLRIDVPLADPSVPLIRQRRRLADLLSTFGAPQWSGETRCRGWSTKDVVAHLVGTNAFWTASVRAGLAGDPTRILTAFDPVSTPEAMVRSVEGTGSEDLLAQLVESNDALARTVGHLDPECWSMPAEAPPGHVAVEAVVLHALWDSWIHERDIMVPLGLSPREEPDEITGSLLYAGALGPAFLATQGSARTGSLAVSAEDVGLEFVVDLGPSVVVRDGPAPPGAAILAGPGVDLVESLSCRGLPPPLPEADRWMISGLPAAFDLVSEEETVPGAAAD